MILNATKKFSTEDKANKFKPPRQEIFVLFSNFKTPRGSIFLLDEAKFYDTKEYTYSM
ncbi:hypothetical protein [Campylobacter concisus]